jgi:hypothetical protein
LSADELDRQLLEAKTPPQRQATATRQAKGSATKVVTDDMLANTLEAAFESIVQKEELSASIDMAVKTASHGIKVLAPLMLAVNRWHDPNTETSQIEATMGDVLKRLHHDARTVIAAYNVKPDDAPAWLVSQVSGQLMEILVKAINRNNGTVMKADDQRYLSPLLNLAKHAENIGESTYAQPNDPKWSLINTLVIATSEVMAEYQNFNYFHEDAAAIAQYITEFLNERVIEGTLADLTERWGLNDQERGYLGVSLVRQAGTLLATAWADSVIPTLSEIKDLPKETRREMLVTGYPLTVVLDAFENSYQGLEVSAVGALRAMSPMRENLNPQSKSGPAYG